MKNLFLVFILSIFVSCESTNKNEEQGNSMSGNDEEAVSYASFGKLIKKDEAFSADKLNELYLGLEVGDSIDVKFASKVNSVCKKKGCWMKLELAKDKETMVRFKEYGFFVPKNSEGREVIVEGIAFVEEISIEDLQHYAKDEGKSDEEISAITEPKLTYSFTAYGVLVQGLEEDFKGQVEGI